MCDDDAGKRARTFVLNVHAFVLNVHPQRFALAEFPRGALPAWTDPAVSRDFAIIMHARGASCVLCAECAVPEAELGGAGIEGGWRLLEFAGVFSFNQTGVLAAVLAPLAAATISILALSSFRTDYVLVKDEQLEHAVDTLRAAGHTIRWLEPRYGLAV